MFLVALRAAEQGLGARWAELYAPLPQLYCDVSAFTSGPSAVWGVPPAIKCRGASSILAAQTEILISEEASSRASAFPPGVDR